DDGRAARTLLVEEGFRDEGYVDIFDAGPTMIAMIDELKAVRNRHSAVFNRSDSGDALHDHLIAHGQGGDFRCTIGSIESAGGQAIT
ncbi:arginine N-succinyltransferase, partial [Staphylococcus equorum]|nr:arginine N-succinyltransferase [Staphylococcus equorum]